MKKGYLTKNENLAVAEFKQKIGESLGKNIEFLRLFGSKAKGTALKDSDIDIFVALKKVTSEIRDEVVDIAFEVNLEFDVYISPRVVEKKVLRDPVWKITPFIKAVQKEGIAI